MADSKPKPSRAKSTKVNFVLLKQILDNESSENTEVGDQGTMSEVSDSNQDDEFTEKVTKKKENFGPTGQYPVLFSKRCKSKSCQTKLSAFPLFSVPEDTEWISDEEENGKKSRNKSDEKKKRRRRVSSDSKDLKTGKSQEREKEVKKEDKTKNPDGTRKDFRSEHQLKDTKNPLLQAWLHQKNKLTRKRRKEERKVKRAQRAALEEEERIRNERFEESDKRVSEWFRAKRKEARKVWRQNHPKVSPLEMASDEPNTHSPPPPEYRAIKGFKSQEPTSSSENLFAMNKSNKNFDSTNSSVCEHLTSKVSKNESGHSSSRLSKLQDGHHDCNVKPVRVLTKEESNEVPRMTPQRPKTAHTRTTTRKTVARPKTAATFATTTQNEKQQINKTTKMHNLNYDEWLKLKRKQDKKSIIEKRRELIDSHLDAVIAKLGKQRVESIMSPRKRVDTGLKNYHRSAPRSAPVTKTKTYKWVPEHESPRPEPQGCDCPEVEHLDGKDSVVPSDNLVSSGEPSTQGLPKKKQAVYFCKEVTEKCEDLKPSMDKVLAVLDAEIQKQSKDKNTNKKTPSYKAPSGISTTNATIRTHGSETLSDIDDLSIPGVVESSLENNGNISRPKFPRPKSARPRPPPLVPNTNLTVEEARKKILHDMDVLGLCGDSSEADNINDSNQTLENKKNKSTVRSNYFDYGIDVETPTMEKIELSKG
ncbi:uncharacterized protein LOC116301488 [Actinia tenebrosa]|uniref:Uncharacterized protein LOC116301488 n=1 Tax=Actinia tenebrosa TaxID=6105 RepID=A0A6P8II70_ACTTE|nr:uncharacterized protein LOC116301488 [Actinia tenebrosa]